MPEDDEEKLEEATSFMDRQIVVVVVAKVIVVVAVVVVVVAVAVVVVAVEVWVVVSLERQNLKLFKLLDHLIKQT